MAKRIIYTNNRDTIFGTSLNRVLSHMNKYQCMLISAYRGEYTAKINKQRATMLSKDIQASGLSFTHVGGGYVENQDTSDEKEVIEDTFLIVNFNKYTEQDFTKLGVDWCADYDQDSVMITVPTEDDKGQIASIRGILYNKNGNVIMEFDNINMHTVEEFFTEVHGKSFVLSSIGDIPSDDINNELSSCFNVMRASNEFIRNNQKYDYKKLMSRYTRPPSCYKIEYIDNVPLSDELFFDNGNTFNYSGDTYCLKDFIPYNKLSRNVANYYDMFGEIDYPRISIYSPIIIQILDDGTVDVYEEVEID